jgi:hypothetical protein
MPVLVGSPEPTLTTQGQPSALLEVLRGVARKRETDLVRFRTCCADPRASK